MKYKYLFIFLFFSSILLSSCVQNGSKINGISFVASSEKVNLEHIEPVQKLNANHASIMPFGFIKNVNNPTIYYNTKNQWYGERIEGTRQYIEVLHQQNIQVMLKPQIWISHGVFTGYLKMNNEEDWLTLEESYRNFIIDFAKLAQETKVSIFCIGTEMELFIKNRPAFWKRLLLEIKEEFSGKLTYAANWDEYKRVPFWNELDFIGIDAYFPVSKSKTPTIEESKIGWDQWKKEMKSISDSINKKVLFTEFGYRSVDFSGKEPWKSDRNSGDVNIVAQNNTTIALFEKFWTEEWFAGGYIWKWFLNHHKVGGMENNMFTPQNKPVEKIIREYYSN